MFRFASGTKKSFKLRRNPSLRSKGKHNHRRLSTSHDLNAEYQTQRLIPLQHKYDHWQEVLPELRPANDAGSGVLAD